MLPRIYILNLPCKPDRREGVAVHLADLGAFKTDWIRWVQGGRGFEI
jgi:hypothetical protein